MMIRRALAGLVARWRCQRAVDSAVVTSFRAIRSGRVRRLLVLCYGNICRSPFVERILTQRLEHLIEVRSRGFHQREGRSSPDRHALQSQKHGVDLSGHASMLVSPLDIAWADIVVLMDRHNWHDLQKLTSGCERVVWLGVFDGGAVEIPDPYSLDDAEAEVVLVRLVACSNRLSDLLLRKSCGQATSDPVVDAATPAT